MRKKRNKGQGCKRQKINKSARTISERKRNLLRNKKQWT